MGFRKINAATCSWVARMRNETGHNVYKALGYAEGSFDFDKAKEAAQDAGIVNDEATVEKACMAYVEDRQREKGKACAHDAEKRFERSVYGAPFGAILLSKLRTPRLKEWRDALGLSKGSSNRTLIAARSSEDAMNIVPTKSQQMIRLPDFECGTDRQRGEVLFNVLQ
jgi:hypothetical protein